jgi:DICT domain-containing protein
MVSARPNRTPAQYAVARRQRAYRQRLSRGERICQVAVNSKLLEVAVGGRFTDQESRSRRYVAQELAMILEQWCDEYLQQCAAGY